AVRTASLRAGPLRVAVLANADAAQADAAVRAVDRWVARRPGETRTCPAAASLAGAHGGTYAVELPPGASAEALIAVPIPPGDPAARAAAHWIAAALDGPSGLLARALGRTGKPDSAEAGLASDSSASVVGSPRAPALVVHLVAPNPELDAAVAQTRALLDRVREGALRDEDRARAAAAIARESLGASLDPRRRTIDLWRAAPPSPSPSLDALRAFAASMTRDESMVIVAARPPRPDPSERPSPADREFKGGRDAGRE
ncbi:MAG: hypothetical protein JOZ69_22540, partial [Myxococcales bacterium]|nr:hypothetical protein [Myxococcales bacterium]